MDNTDQRPFRVTLLGTGAPPPVIDRFGPSTLIEAGNEKLVFDAGRGALQRLFQLKIPFGEITGLFLTHLHSDHVVGLPDLWLTGWLGQPWGRRTVPLPVWGPAESKDMLYHLEKAYQFDIRVRSRNYLTAGATLLPEEFSEGVVYEKNGLKVTAFEVDHGHVKPAFGFRIDYEGKSVVLSGDTCLNENLIAYSQGADLLVHEVAAGTGFRDPMRNPTGDAVMAGAHTAPDEAGEVFSRVKPKLAVYSHILLRGSATVKDLVTLTRTKYTGPLEVGEDLMSFNVDKEITRHRFEYK